MAYVTYDKAKWHWGAKNAPTDIPQENGATHIAFFLVHGAQALFQGLCGGFRGRYSADGR